MSKNYDRFENIIDGIFGGGTYFVDPNDYSSIWARHVMSAQDAQRAGNYDSAIDKYLRMFESTRNVYPSLMGTMYKAVLCSGELDFAYEVIVYAELFAVKVWGRGDSLTFRRKEFEEVLDKIEREFSSSVVVGAGYDDKTLMEKMSSASIKKIELFSDLIERFAVNGEYGPFNVATIDRCLDLRREFRRLYRGMLY